MAMESILRSLKAYELVLKNMFKGPFRPSDSFLFPIAGLQPNLIGLDNYENVSKDHQELEDKKSEGFVWGVPKGRRTLEVRTERKFGYKRWVWKPFVPLTDLRVCDNCGHHYRAKHLCRNCYEKVKAETKAIREAVEAKLGDAPEDQSIVVLYENDAKPVDSAPKKNLIVEMKKERPWFSQNLLQRSTTGPDSKTTTIAVTPKNLG